MPKRVDWRSIVPDPELMVCQENLDGFYKFIHERHMIFHRRSELKQDPPWTDDAWLRDYKFTNVYRELDRGTVWLLNNIVTEEKDQKNLVWKITLYRLLNNLATFDDIGVPRYQDYNPSAYKKKLEARKARGERVFTNAHLTLPTFELGSTKIDEYINSLNDLHSRLDDVFMQLKNASHLKEVFEIMMQCRRVGPFIAYEICIDLMYAQVVPFTEDDWVNLGPGAKVGIRLIFPNKKTDMVDGLTQLRKDQRKHFKRLGLIFPFYQGRELTLRNIEHSLCEFGKYWKLSHSAGKSRMKFVASLNPLEIQIQEEPKKISGI